MEWEEYQQAYYGFHLSVSQTTVTSIVAGEVMEGFPGKLPKSLKVPIISDLRSVLLAVQKMLSEADIPGVSDEITDIDLPSPEDKADLVRTYKQSLSDRTADSLFHYVLDLVMVAAQLKISTSDLDFQRLLNSQQLVMILAHLDAFMADSLRALCYARPEVLKSQKKIDWETVISCGGWNGLLTHLVEEYVFQFGWQSISERVHSLQKQRNLFENFSETDLDLLKEAENLRNVVIHNGGRVSQEYLARTGREDLEIGQFVPVPVEFIDKVAEAASLLVSWLFLEISGKFFGVDISEIDAIFGIDDKTLLSLEQVGT